MDQAILGVPLVCVYPVAGNIAIGVMSEGAAGAAVYSYSDNGAGRGSRNTERR